jgi:hypothetical protein
MKTAQLGRGAVIGCAAAASVVLAAGTAYAYLTTTGSGTGSASTANGLTAFHTTATVAPGAKLYPDSSAPLALNVDNSGNTYTLTVTSVALDTGRPITVTGGSGCTNPAITVSASGWVGVTVAPGATSGALIIANAVSMGVGADNGCQGATFTIPVTLTGHN